MGVRDSKTDRTELERVLGDTFRVDPVTASEIGAYLAQSFAEDNTQGQIPGLTYVGGSQTQKSGLHGRKAMGLMERWEKLFLGIDRSKCGWLANAECLEILSRLLEQTFRNFQQHVRTPSHVAPPFSARPVDAFPAGVVAIPAAPAPFTTVVSFTVPSPRFRGEITAAGYTAESAAAFTDLEWRITVDGTPLAPWNTIRAVQLWLFVPPTPLCAPIHLRARQTIELQARSLAAGPHSVLGRLCGWVYPTRTESGDDIRSTIVD